MKLLKIAILLLFLWSLPTFIQKVFGDSFGSIFSYLSFLLIAFYYYIGKKGSVVMSLLILGLSYFVISGLVNAGYVEFFIFDFVKYFLLIICGAQLVRNSTNKELFYILLLGAFTIFINALYFQEGWGGRYGGVFLNPNGAGFICIIGYCLGYSISNKFLRVIGQFAFVFAGILTLSRTFIVLWIIISIVAAITNRKHLLTIGIGMFAVILLLSISTYLKLDTMRFSALESLLENKIDKQVISEDSRSETWSLYTDVILNNVFFGNGYKSMQGMEADTVGIKVGVHNTYLMILGESGIIPFLIFIIILLKSFVKSIVIHFKENPYYSFIIFVLILFMLTSHNFFDNYAMLIIVLWVYTKVNDSNEKITEINPIKTQ